MAETGGGGPVGVLVRILCVAGGAVFGAFLLALFAPGAATARADSGIEPVPAAAVDVVAAQPSDDDAFWAQPDAMSSAAARRAAVVADDAEPGHWVRTSHRADDASSAASAAGHGRVGAATSIPLGTLGTGGGSTDGGPSISQLAVLSSALAAVLWFSQRLRHGEVRARSAFIFLSLERPG